MKWLIFTLLALTAHADDGLSDKFRQLWLDLVSINTGTGNVEGLNAVRKKLIPEFEKLGFKSQLIDGGQGHKVLAFRFPEPGLPRIALIGHLDTVFPKESPFQKPVFEGEWVHGPGAQDMKGGIVMILDALTEVKDPNLLKQIVVLLNDDEETGSKFSATILKEQTNEMPYALVYEGPIVSSESVTTTEAGVNWIEVNVKGQAAHAGWHEDGINACVELGQKIVEIAKLTDYKKRLTVNTGVIEGGTKANVVCEEATATIDIRYVNPADLERTRKAIDKIAAKSSVYNPKLKRGTQTEVRELLLIPSLSPEVTKDLFSAAREETKKLGMDLKGEFIGGTSDGNQLASTGIKILVGLGVYGQNPHTDQERADFASYGRRKQLSVSLIKRLLK